MTTDTKLTPKQLMVLDYMRGNGGKLDHSGARQLVNRGSFSRRGLHIVLDNLFDKGLLAWAHADSENRYPCLSRAGLHASEEAHR